VNFNTASKKTQVSVLIGCTHTLLPCKLVVEKLLVMTLQSEVHDAQVQPLPLPKTLDNKRSSIECLVDCTSSKGTHLKTKVKTICESVLSCRMCTTGNVFLTLCPRPKVWYKGRTLINVQRKLKKILTCSTSAAMMLSIWVCRQTHMKKLKGMTYGKYQTTTLCRQ
jgi:hypothetical protein